MVRLKFLFATLVIGTLLATATVVGGTVKADQFDTQIRALNQQNAAAQVQSDSLAATAANYQAAIDQLSAQISALQALISQTQAKIDDLNAQIAQAQADLAQEKKVLGENIKTMYLEGDVSTLEVLASSKDLSDFVNKQQYRNSVGDKIKTSVDKINALKAELQKQQEQQQSLLHDQQTQQTQLQASQTQQTAMLNYTEGQKSAYDQQISTNNSQIASLRAQQIAANRRLVGSGNVNIISGGNCGGGYPGTAGPGAWGGYWGCNYGQDNTLDNWGMYNRECVSYTAWKVYSAYGYMPYGLGNADDWPATAASHSIAEGSVPKVGSVAIGTNPYWFGSVGHAMWVEAVSGDQILVSQFNFSAPGQYSQMWISSSLITTFIYFGG